MSYFQNGSFKIQNFTTRYIITIKGPLFPYTRFKLFQAIIIPNIQKFLKISVLSQMNIFWHRKKNFSMNGALNVFNESWISFLWGNFKDQLVNSWFRRGCSIDLSLVYDAFDLKRHSLCGNRNEFYGTHLNDLRTRLGW